MKYQLIIPALCLIPIVAISGCGGSGGTGSSNDPEPIGDACIVERDNLIQSIRTELDTLATSTDFTLLIESNDGRQLEHNRGASTKATSYRSASTSKMVTAAVILSLVEKGTLSLQDKPQDYIETWPEFGNLSEISLAHLLSFTSGVSDEALCVNLPNSDFESCVSTTLSNNLQNEEAGGESFYYSSSHLQVAGLMAVKASELSSWQAIFDQFKSESALFSQSYYDLPSLENPRLAGGMHWTGLEYFEFLNALFNESILTTELIQQMTQDQISSATIDNSPAFDGLNEDWHYGFGSWIECHSTEFNCSEVTRVSSPGAYGAYPFIDYEHGYFGILAREGALGTFTEGYSVFDSVSGKLEQWAAKTCQ
ncbi:MAG: beta-lactamase family protein [Kangiellaceae bacterium]|nr:beta-lactamase family protein [Kangiellaceae bacterium]